MNTQFNIIYAIRYFNGQLTSGTVELTASRDTTKQEVEDIAMVMVRRHINSQQDGDYPFDAWIENVQKIDLTVTQIQ